MISRRQLHENAVGNPLMKFVRQLRKDMDYLLHHAIVSPEQLSDLCEDLGYIQAGAFICGTGSLEDGDFTGNMMVYPPYEDAVGDLFTIFGMNAGVLQVGWNSADGKLYAGGKAVIIDQNGILGYYGGAITYWLQSDGDVFIGSNVGAPATTSFVVFSNAQTYNTESIGAGDVLFGCNTAAYANMLWDVSDKRLRFRTGQTTKFYVGTDGVLHFGTATEGSSPSIYGDGDSGDLYIASGDSGVLYLTALASIILNAPVIDLSGASTLTLPNNSVSYAKIQDVSATSRLLGRVTAGAGDIEELTAANVRSIVQLGAILTAQAGEDTIDAASTEYLPLSGVAAANVYVKRNFIIPFAGTAQNLYVRTTTAQPVGGSLVMTVQKNNVDTVVTVTVAAGGAAAITADTTHSFTFAKGDRLTLAAVNNAGSNVSAAISAISLELLKDV